MLNEIMGTALIMGLHCYAIRETEVGNINVEINTLAIRGFSMPFGSDRNKSGDAYSWNDESMLNMNIPEYRPNISAKEIKRLIERANIITEDAFIQDYIVFTLESFTHLQSGEYPQSFVMGWIVVEKYVTSLWREYIHDKAISGKRKNKLQTGMLWTIDDKLETLNLAGTMEDSDYKTLMKLKGKRNKILHQGQKASKEDAEICFRAASNITHHTVVTKHGRLDSIKKLKKAI